MAGRPRQNNGQVQGAAASLLNGLAVLEAFTVKNSVLGVTEVAQRVGLHKSTVSRILGGLAEAGYVQRDEEKNNPTPPVSSDRDESPSPTNPFYLKSSGKDPFAQYRKFAAPPGKLGVIYGGPYRRPADTRDAWTVAFMWLGFHPEERSLKFKEGDAFTEDLRTSEYYRDLYVQISDEVKSGIYNNTTYSRSLSEDNGSVFFSDVGTITSLGTNGGSVALAYLGSHTIQTRRGDDSPDGSLNIHFRVYNTTTLESATRFPFFGVGYSEWYKVSTGAYWSNISLFSGFGRFQEQEVTWTENIK